MKQYSQLAHSVVDYHTCVLGS